MLDKRILIVDDEMHIRELIKFNLEKNGFKTIQAADGGEAVELAKERQVDLIVLDLMLPVMDGFEVCKEIRKDSVIGNTPIIMLTAKGEEIDKIVGLEIGADDYMTKPFSVRELVARVKAQLRRSSSVKTESNLVKFGDVAVNLQTREVRKNENIVDLTLKEFEILKILIKNKGSIITREVLLDRIWGYEYIGETRTVDVHIRHLRQKIEMDDKNPMFIQTIRGVGYKFICE
ncbi:response regulator transcription factor [uncultured Clostridium sp.]|jgi:two-component system alkaline phosphatase synthesis response regulator PhoP|uniref:response regulator transcription factor n=1 Tax=uncultured Clostridium sp. TaxID=59620 RepID=UPI00261FBEA7|nr:response regulator transcription factor [uncultured Clostridium sp.]